MTGWIGESVRGAEFLTFLLFSSIAILAVLADRSVLDLESIAPEVGLSQKFVYYWQGVVYRFFPGPYVYRFLIPSLYQALNQATHLSLLTIDTISKTLLLIACQYGLYAYLAGFFERPTARLGVFIFDSFLGYLFSYIKGPSIIETIDLLNLWLITLGLMAIHRNQYARLSLLMCLGLLNRETPLILIPISILHEWFQTRRVRSSLLVLFVSTITFIGTRLLIRSWAGPVWFNLDELRTNLAFLFGSPSREALIANLRLLALLAPFLVAGLYKFGHQPLFLKIAACTAPVFIVIHYFVAEIIEARLWLPLFPLLLPLILNHLDGKAGTPTG